MTWSPVTRSASRSWIRVPASGLNSAMGRRKMRRISGSPATMTASISSFSPTARCRSAKGTSRHALRIGGMDQAVSMRVRHVRSRATTARTLR